MVSNDCDELLCNPYYSVIKTYKIVSPYFQVFEDPIEDDSITEFECIEYLPNDSSNMNKLGKHKIETQDLDKYLLPHKAMLEIKR